MIFTTIDFVIFLLLFLVSYLFVDSTNKKLIILSIFNIIFYSYQNIYLFFWLASWSFLIWFGAKKIRFKYLIIVLGIFQVLFFKIYETKLLSDYLSHIITPIGISFFTFQGLTYLFAVNRMPKEKEELHIDKPWCILKTFAFIGFFPTIFSQPF